MNIKGEKKVKLELGGALERLGFKIFDENKKPLKESWDRFQVKNTIAGKRPDLVILGNLQAKGRQFPNRYIAIEIKIGSKHKDILDGFDSVLDYLNDYLWGAEYYVDNQKIDISAIVLATKYSPFGFLFKEEEKFNYKVVKGPWDAYPMTFTIAKILWRQRDNLIKRFQALTGIPKFVKSTKTKIDPQRDIPQIGVLVWESKGKKTIRLMLSAHPYHWKFEPSLSKI